MTWPTLQLSILSTITMGKSLPRGGLNESGEGLPYFFDMTQFAKTHRAVTKWCTAPSSTATGGDILLSVHAPFGQIDIAPGDCGIGGGLAAVRSKSVLVEQAYLASFLKYVKPTFSWRGRVVSEIGHRDIAELEVPVPTISEQKRIIEILNQMDTLRHKRAVADRKMKAVIPSRFMRVFGQDLSVGKSIPLGDVLADLPPRAKKRSTDHGEASARRSNASVHRVGPAEVGDVSASQEEFDQLSLKTGDILIARDDHYADYVGQSIVFGWPFSADTAHTVERLIRSDDVIRARVDNDVAEPWFVQTYLSLAESMGSFRSIGRQYGISSDAMVDALLSIPIPDISVARQREFAVDAQAVAILRGRTEKLSACVDYASSSLLHRAFTGEVTARWRRIRTDQLLREAGEQALYWKG